MAELRQRKGKSKPNGKAKDQPNGSTFATEDSKDDEVNEEAKNTVDTKHPTAKDTSDSQGEVPQKEEAGKLAKWLRILFHLCLWVLRLAALGWVCQKAWSIRLYAVNIYGYVIHEFDPWFNFRATEYLERNGLSKFMTWYDTQSWSPIGRPVGTTIFPGMQITSVLIYRVLQLVGSFYRPWARSLNDICVLVPAGFGAVSSLFTFALTWEISGSANAGVVAAGIMAVIPAHLMRSVAGGYDNESVAVSIICCTFYLWVRSLRRGSRPVLFGILTGLSYIYMVATWGGYVFVLNMIGLHAAILVLMGRFSTELYRSYSLFYIIGTAGAVQIPVVGWNPIRSAEQMGPMAVFLGMQVLQLVIFLLNRKQTSRILRWGTLYGIIVVLVAGGAYGIIWLQNKGYAWEFSVRVKSLFIKHTRTGNPLVDSVAEHQSTPTSAYVQYLHYPLYLAPFGVILCLLRWTDAAFFLVAYCITAGYFSFKMIRLVLLCAPAVSAAAGIALVLPFEWALRQFISKRPFSILGIVRRIVAVVLISVILGLNFVQLPLQRKPYAVKYAGFPIDIPTGYGVPYTIHTGFQFNIPKPNITRAWNMVRKQPSRLLLKKTRAQQYLDHCEELAEHMSEPQIIVRGKGPKGETLIIDDFREAYHWLRDNTPEDARVMAWWDYGYQITGIGNRTSIADGNTWNHEHIALLGRCLVSSEAKGHSLIRHLADYVLVWTTRYAGMYSDDLAKSPHMARISGSVYPDIDPSKFYIDQYGNPSRMMRESVLFRLHYYRLDPAAGVTKLTYFREAYTTKYRMVRIYKVLNVSLKSKRHPFGTYPPALKPTLSMAKDFSEVKRLERLKAGKFD